MGIFREYIDKQASLVSENIITNASLNPVWELVRDRYNYSRYVFEINISELINKVNNKEIISDRVKYHKLHFTNTIRFRDELIGKSFYGLQRDKGFALELVELIDDFDEGVGYDYEYADILQNSPIIPNFYFNAENSFWTVSGAVYTTSATTGYFVVTPVVSGNTLTGQTIITGETVNIATITGDTFITGGTTNIYNITGSTSITGETINIITITGDSSYSGQTGYTGVTGYSYSTGFTTGYTTVTGYSITTGFTTGYTTVTGYSYSTGFTTGYTTGDTFVITGITYITGATTYPPGYNNILATQFFKLGNDDIDFDITNYVQSAITSNKETLKFCIKYTYPFEQNNTFTKLQAVAFHSKYTNTYFEPFLETNFDDFYDDDRFNFYIQKLNKLYLITRVNGEAVNLDTPPLGVNLYDYEDNFVLQVPTSGVTHEGKGIYSVKLKVTKDYPDQVIFRDIWFGLNYQGESLDDVEQEFVLKNANKYYNFNDYENNSYVQPSNYHFTFQGIYQNERVKSNEIRRIILLKRELYRNHDDTKVQLEYRVFIKQGDNEYDVIPFTKVSKIGRNYEFNLDMAILIPHVYFIQLRMKSNGIYYSRPETLSFNVIGEIFT